MMQRNGCKRVFSSIVRCLRCEHLISIVWAERQHPGRGAASPVITRKYKAVIPIEWNIISCVPDDPSRRRVQAG